MQKSKIFLTNAELRNYSEIFCFTKTTPRSRTLIPFAAPDRFHERFCLFEDRFSLKTGLKRSEKLMKTFESERSNALEQIVDKRSRYNHVYQFRILKKRLHS